MCICITFQEKLTVGQNPRTFGRHQDAIAGYVQQKSCRIWDVGGYRRGNPLLRAGIAMIEIGKTLQLVGGFKGGHNWITNPNNASTMSLNDCKFALFDSSQDGYFNNDPCFNPNWNQQSNWIISPSRGNKTHLKTQPSLHPAAVLSKSLVLKKATLSYLLHLCFPLIAMLLLCPPPFWQLNRSAECTWEYSRQLTLKLGTYVSKTTPLWSSLGNWSTQSGTCELEN